MTGATDGPVVAIRPAETADVPAIQRIAREAWAAAYGGFVAESTIEELLEEWYSDEAVRRGVTSDDVVYLVAVDEGSAVGYASAHEETEREGESGTAILSSIYAVPDRWGDGVGTALLEAVTARLERRGVDRIRATVLAENDVGRAFYDRRGFERAAEHEEELGGERYGALVVERPIERR